MILAFSSSIAPEIPNNKVEICGVTDINSKCRSKAAFFSSLFLYNLRIIEPLHKHKLNFASAHNSMMHLTLKSEKYRPKSF